MTHHAMERRKYNRNSVDIVLDIYAKGKVVSRARGLMTDISLGGAKIETLAEFQKGDTLIVELDRPDGKPLMLQGAILHVLHGDRLSTYGIRFTKLGLFGRFKIQKFIKATLAKRQR